MPMKKEDLPATLRRSPEKAQRTFAETLESAEGTYGPGERARRTAFAALKHAFEKVGDHWEPKAEKGPSDAQAARGGASARRGGRTHGGVDVEGHTKAELLARAKELGVERTSKLDKAGLADAIAAKQQGLDRKALARERERGG